MASPPFNLNLAVPGDTDLISQFPGVDRTHLDIINSWLTTEHDTNGRHSQVSMPWQADPAGVANVTRVWASSTGNAIGILKYRQGTGGIEYVGPPPGSIMAYASTTAPVGWLFCNGLPVSRAAFARLFDIIGTTFGVGDGSSTFNVPDLQQRVVVGQGGVGGATSPEIVTVAGSGINGDVIGTQGGAQNNTLVQGNLPNFTLPNTLGISDTRVWAGSKPGSNATVAGNADAILQPSGANTTIVVPISITGGSISLTGSITTDGASTPFTNMPPTIVLPFIIKY